jgi:hypothetical protein
MAEKYSANALKEELVAVHESTLKHNLCAQILISSSNKTDKCSI